MEAALLIALGAVLVLAGFVGLLFPALPGAPLVFGGLLLIAWAEAFDYVGAVTLTVLGLMAALTYPIDFLAGILGAKRYGASPRALVGAGVGAIVGIFFGLPGILLGPFAGACIGEFSANPKLLSVARVGVGTTIGLVVSIALKIAIAFSMVGIFAVVRFA